MKTPEIEKEYPGPGQYSLGAKRNSVAFTLKPKITDHNGKSFFFLITNLDPAEIMSKQSVPGPGQYETIEMGGFGKYPLQRMKNSGAACWSPPSSKRFADESRLGGNLPHHSTYTPEDTSSGTYLLSQSKTYHVPKIGPSFGPIKQIDDRKTKAEERKKRTCK